MSKTPSQSKRCYKEAWTSFEKLLERINEEAKKRSQLNVTQTSLFVRIIADSPPINPEEFEKYCARKKIGIKDKKIARSFVLPERVNDRINELLNPLPPSKNKSEQNVLSYIITNTSITENNYFS